MRKHSYQPLLIRLLASKIIEKVSAWYAVALEKINNNNKVTIASYLYIARGTVHRGTYSVMSTDSQLITAEQGRTNLSFL